MGKNALRRCCHLTRFSCFIILLVVSVLLVGWLTVAGSSRFGHVLRNGNMKIIFCGFVSNKPIGVGRDDGFNNVQSRSLQGNTVVNWIASYIKTAKHVLMIFLVKLLRFKFFFFVSSLFFWLIDMCYWMVFGYQGDLVSLIIRESCLTLIDGDFGSMVPS